MKREIDMDQEVLDLGWQQLQSHIERFLGQALKSGIQSIEYRPRFIAPLLAAPAEHQNERREAARWNALFYHFTMSTWESVRPRMCSPIV